MASAVLASVSVAAPACALGTSSSVLSSKSSAVMAAPRLSPKLVCNKSRVVMSASAEKEYNLAGLTGVALLAATIIPEIAEAAQPGISPSLKNLLLSVVAGGVVLAVLGVVVAGVSTFDPVKRQ